MTWRQTLGFKEETVVDLAAAQQRYRKLVEVSDQQICERRRLKQAIESARRELASRPPQRQRVRFL